MARRRIILTIATALFLAVIGLLGWPNISHRGVNTSATGGSGVLLVRPAFAQDGSFLDQEAGIATIVGAGLAGYLGIRAARRR